MTPPQRLVLTVAILGSFVAFLDSTIVNVALPAIARDLGGGLSTQQWTVDAYLITLNALILVAGAVSDAFGRILVLRIGLIAFGLYWRKWQIIRYEENSINVFAWGDILDPAAYGRGAHEVGHAVSGAGGAQRHGRAQPGDERVRESRALG